MMHLIIPGMHNSGPGHWQTLWEESFPQQFKRVQQENWSAPMKDDWVAAVHAAISVCEGPVILVAHSLGCTTVAHWANENRSTPIGAALLVAPADPDHARRNHVSSFCPVPKQPLPFASIVVASTNDPYTGIEQSARLAACWGSRFISVGDKGHINAQSGLGLWNDGLSVLSSLRNYVAAQRR